MYTVLADSIDAACEASLIVESVFTRLTDSTVRSALLFERHSTRVLQSLAGSVQLHQGEDCWNIDIGLINRVTGFDIQDQSSYLSHLHTMMASAGRPALRISSRLRRREGVTLLQRFSRADLLRDAWDLRDSVRW